MTTPEPAPVPEPAPATPAPGEVRRYAVQQHDGSTRQQLILVTGANEDGVTGVPVGYEDAQAVFPPGALS